MNECVASHATCARQRTDQRARAQTAHARQEGAAPRDAHTRRPAMTSRAPASAPHRTHTTSHAGNALYLLLASARTIASTRGLLGAPVDAAGQRVDVRRRLRWHRRGGRRRCIRCGGLLDGTGGGERRRRGLGRSIRRRRGGRSRPCKAHHAEQQVVGGLGVAYDTRGDHASAVGDGLLAQLLGGHLVADQQTTSSQSDRQCARDVRRRHGSATESRRAVVARCARRADVAPRCEQLEAIAVVRKWAPVVGWRDARSFAAHSSVASGEGIGQEARRHRCSRQARASGAACVGRVIDARAPGCTHALSSVEPTVSASAERAGVLAQASPFWFPAETTVRTPSCFAAWMASSIACSVPAPLSDMLATTFLPSERPPASRCLTTKSRASSTSPKVPAPSSSRTLTAITRVVAHLSTPHLSFASEAKATPRRRWRGARARARVTVSASRHVRVPRARAPSFLLLAHRALFTQGTTTQLGTHDAPCARSCRRHVRAVGVVVTRAAVLRARRRVRALANVTRARIVGVPRTHAPARPAGGERIEFYVRAADARIEDVHVRGGGGLVARLVRVLPVKGQGTLIDAVKAHHASS